MTKGLEKLLNIRPLDEVLEENGVNYEDIDEEIEQTLTEVRHQSARANLLEGTDHGEAMDSLHDETLKHARDLMDYGFNIDMPRQRGIFEIAASMYGHALSAKNSKRDMQIKSLKLALETRKLEMGERRAGLAQEQAATEDGEGVIVVEDRNELLRKLREQIKADAAK